jgi:hypothetical protein
LAVIWKHPSPSVAQTVRSGSAAASHPWPQEPRQPMVPGTSRVEPRVGRSYLMYCAAHILVRPTPEA